MTDLITAMAAVALDPRPWIMIGIIAAIIAVCALTERRGAKNMNPWEK